MPEQEFDRTRDRVLVWYGARFLLPSHHAGIVKLFEGIVFVLVEPFGVNDADNREDLAEDHAYRDEPGRSPSNGHERGRETFAHVLLT